MKIAHVRLIAALLVSLGFATLSDAQTLTGGITGTVSNDTGTRVAGVVVTVQNQLTGARETATTDAEGKYQFAGLPVDGDYQIRVALPDFETQASETVTLVPGAILVVNFRVKLSITGSIEVTSAVPVRESGGSTVQQTMNDELVHALPLAGRNFIPLATLTAGFTGNPNFPNPLGQAYWSNNIIVDGASHFSKWRSAPRTFYSGYSLESIKEVQVLTSRFSAEYGESLATVTRVVTRSGTDQFHGSGLLFAQSNSWNQTPAFAQVNPPGNSQQFGFTIGGPLQSDQTHFLESYEGRRSRNKNIVVSPDDELNGTFAKDDQDEHLVFFRLDHRLDEQHQVMARYNGQFFRWRNEPGGLMLAGSGTHYRNDVHTLLATDRTQLTGRLLGEARFQFARYIDARDDLQPSVFISRAGFSQEGGQIGAYGFGAEPEDTWEGADTFSMIAGTHVLRFGGGAKYVRSHNAFLNYGRGAYFFAGSPDQFPSPYLYVQGIAPDATAAQADPRSLSSFGFVQDDWRYRPRLTLNLGLRYDIERISSVRNYVVPVDVNNLQPRIGAAWEPFSDARTVVRAGVGIYTQQQLLYYINRVQLEGEGGAITLSLTPDSPLFPRFPNTLTSLPQGLLPARDIQQVDRGFRNPYSVQASGGIEHAFTQGTLSIDYLYLNGRGLMSLVDENAPASIGKPAQRSVAQADLTRPIPALPGQVRKVITLGNLGESWYRALQVKGERSVGRVQTVVSYTLSHAEDLDNYELPEDSRNLDAERARASTDIKHNVTVGFTWQLPERRYVAGWTLSGIGAFRSGRPYTITWGDDRNGTTQNDARPGGRNTASTDGYQNVDLALERRFSRGPAAITARIEAFNVFNTTNFDQYVGQLLSPLFAKPVSAFPMRRIELAAIVRF